MFERFSFENHWFPSSACPELRQSFLRGCQDKSMHLERKSIDIANNLFLELPQCFPQTSPELSKSFPRASPNHCSVHQLFVGISSSGWHQLLWLAISLGKWSFWTFRRQPPDFYTPSTSRWHQLLWLVSAPLAASLFQGWWMKVSVGVSISWICSMRLISH